MRSYLPFPKTLDKISLLYGLNKHFISKRGLIGKQFSIDSYITQMKTGKKYNHTSIAYDILNMYFLNRSMHQINEACNKLWSTLEIHHSVKNKNNLFKKFSTDFLPSSTVPTLHYANISALLSILSLFGLTSIARRGRNLTFYNLVRTQDGIILLKRDKYLRNVCGYAKSGWHAQVIQTYEGLERNGIALPKIEINDTKKLQFERSKFHYDILGQTSMAGTIGIKSFFNFLPSVVSSLDYAISSIYKVVKPIPNSCGTRFKELKAKISKIIR